MDFHGAGKCSTAADDEECNDGRSLAASKHAILKASVPRAQAALGPPSNDWPCASSPIGTGNVRHTPSITCAGAADSGHDSLGEPEYRPMLSCAGQTSSSLPPSLAKHSLGDQGSEPAAGEACTLHNSGDQNTAGMSSNTTAMRNEAEDEYDICKLHESLDETSEGWQFATPKRRGKGTSSERHEAEQTDDVDTFLTELIDRVKKIFESKFPRRHYDYKVVSGITAQILQDTPPASVLHTIAAAIRAKLQDC